MHKLLHISETEAEVDKFCLNQESHQEQEFIFKTQARSRSEKIRIRTSLA